MRLFLRDSSAIRRAARRVSGATSSRGGRRQQLAACAFANSRKRGRAAILDRPAASLRTTAAARRGVERTPGDARRRRCRGIDGDYVLQARTAHPALGEFVAVGLHRRAVPSTEFLSTRRRAARFERSSPAGPAIGVRARLADFAPRRERQPPFTPFGKHAAPETGDFVGALEIRFTRASR